MTAHAETLERDAASDVVSEIRRALSADELIPYLGPGLLALSDSVLPSAPEAVAVALNKRALAPQRIRANMWSVAQFIESRRHRKTLQSFMAEIFAAQATPAPLVRHLAKQKLSLIVNTWYDDALTQALRDIERSDFVEIQGVSRSGYANIWTRAYSSEGYEIESADADSARLVVYSPHGGVRPAKNFLVSDSDYVEAMTEIDIQSPIPDAVKARRSSRGFLFLGCRFHDQMLRTYARQIIKRSKGPHYAAIDAASATRNELKFLDEQNITPLPMSLEDFETRLIG